MTLGGGEMNNPGRYLTLLPPINGATAITGTPYYTENAGDRAQMHDGTITFDYMPSQFITLRLESGYRYSDMPYWTGRRRHHASRRKQRLAGAVCLRNRRALRLRLWHGPDDCQCSLRRIGNLDQPDRRQQRHLVARSAHKPDRQLRRDHGAGSNH